VADKGSNLPGDRQSDCAAGAGIDAHLFPGGGLSKFVAALLALREHPGHSPKRDFLIAHPTEFLRGETADTTRSLST
jgi:hypothetical protein